MPSIFNRSSPKFERRLADKRRSNCSIYSQNGFNQCACAAIDFRNNEIFLFRQRYFRFWQKTEVLCAHARQPNFRVCAVYSISLSNLPQHPHLLLLLTCGPLTARPSTRVDSTAALSTAGLQPRVESVDCVESKGLGRHHVQPNISLSCFNIKNMEKMADQIRFVLYVYVYSPTRVRVRQNGIASICTWEHFCHTGTVWQLNNEEIFDCRLLSWYVEYTVSHYWTCSIESSVQWISQMYNCWILITPVCDFFSQPNEYSLACRDNLCDRQHRCRISEITVWHSPSSPLPAKVRSSPSLLFFLSPSLR